MVLMTSCSASTSSDDDFSAKDIMFAQMMIPHHEQAIEMSDLALQNSTNPEIRDLATKIKGEQAPEIELMEAEQLVINTRTKRATSFLTR